VKVGVIIPARNTRKYIEAMLTTVHAQTHPCHAYIVDDCSDDGMTSLLRSRPDWYRALAHNNERQGWPLSLNRAADMALNDGCDAIAYASSDDMLRLDYTAKLVDALTDAPWSISYGQQIGDENVVQTTLAPFPLSLDDFAGTHCPLGCSALFRREVWEHTRGYDVSVSLPGSYGYNEDWEHWIRVMKAFGSGVLVPEPLYYFVMREGQLHKEGLGKHAAARALIAAKHPDVFSNRQWAPCPCGCTEGI
jgi:glycosyltransferase involved in cell wall biosynthesis